MASMASPVSHNQMVDPIFPWFSIYVVDFPMKN